MLGGDFLVHNVLRRLLCAWPAKDELHVYNMLRDEFLVNGILGDDLLLRGILGGKCKVC